MRIRVACLLVLATAVACTGERAQEEHGPGPGSAPAGPAAAAANDHSTLAQRLVAGLRPAPENGSVHVEIDHQALHELTRDETRNEIDALRDPLQAARLFGPALGLGGNAQYSLRDEPLELRAGPGLFFATVVVEDGKRRLALRLTSEPDANEEPTLWLVNDFYEMPRPAE